MNFKKIIISVCFFVLGGTHTLLAQYTGFYVTSYECAPGACIDFVNAPTYSFTDLAMDGYATCDPDVAAPEVHPYVWVDDCRLANRLQVNVGVEQRQEYEPGMGLIIIEGLRARGDISVLGGNTWYAGYEDNDCDGGSTYVWPPEEPC